MNRAAAHKFLLLMGAGAVAAALLMPPPDRVAPQIVTAQTGVERRPVADRPPSGRVVNVARVNPQRVPPIVGAHGLTATAKSVAAYIQSNYPGVQSIGGVRPCDQYAEHCRGIAVDIMIGADKGIGDRICADILTKPGVRYAIWRETIRYPSGYQRWMADRGTPTANHHDHIHIRVRT